MKLRRKTSFFRYRFCGLILLQNIILSLALIALTRPALFGIPASSNNGVLDLLFCDYIYWISYLFVLVPTVLHPLRSWTFYFNYQSSRAKLLASTADPSLFQPMHDIPWVRIDLQWFLLKKKFANLKYAAVFYLLLIGLTGTAYVVIRFTTNQWFVDEDSLDGNLEYCPMMIESTLLGILGFIALFLNLVMGALLGICKENIQLDNETSGMNVALIVVLTIYFLTMFESVCEVANCEDFRRIMWILFALVYMIGNTLFPLGYYYFKFKKGLADQSALKENLQQVFNNPQLKVQFKEFLVSEFSVENFLFLEAIKKYKKKYEGEVDLNCIRQGAQEVYNEFFNKVIFIYLGCTKRFEHFTCYIKVTKHENARFA